MTKNKEFGSDFSLQLDTSTKNPFYNNKEIPLFFSGRVALYALLQWGVQYKKWCKVYFPSYYCHEVVDFVRPLDIEIAYVSCNPWLANGMNIDFEIIDIEGNVFINVDYFGIKKIECNYRKNLIIIDDLTHNLDHLNHSKADYCFGSLRKILPLPCGGFLFSQRNKDLPVGINSQFSEEISIKKLTAMYLKKIYLEGEDINKEVFRTLYITGEEAFSKKESIGKMPLSAQSVLQYLDLDSILNSKIENLKLAFDLLLPFENVGFNFSQNEPNSLGLILQFHNYKMKLDCQQYLIMNKVYPAVLWPNQKEKEDIEHSKLMLFIHMDVRYDRPDIIYLASLLNEFFEKYDTDN